jgi:uncharacterized protein YfeS
MSTGNAPAAVFPSGSSGVVGNVELMPVAQSHFYDDDEIGLARETSHPNFVAIASEDFYYDTTDDFSPFGNDDGSDTLSCLQEWYQAGGTNPKVTRFLNQLLADWDFGVPKKLHLASPEAIEKWLAKDEMNETFLESECCARIATAFGQLKITGTMTAECAADGTAAIRCLLWMIERAAIKYPAWPHGASKRSRLLAMQSAIVLAGTR